MVKPIDALGFGPKRVLTTNADGSTTITVSPPAFTKLPPQSITLTSVQLEGYHKWCNGTLIQNALPDLSPSDREILITGIGPIDFARLADDEEEEE